MVSIRPYKEEVDHNVVQEHPNFPTMYRCGVIDRQCKEQDLLLTRAVIFK